MKRTAETLEHARQPLVILKTVGGLGFSPRRLEDFDSIGFSPRTEFSGEQRRAACTVTHDGIQSRAPLRGEEGVGYVGYYNGVTGKRVCV